MQIPKSTIVNAFEKYQEIIFKIDVDLNFWTSFMNASISTYQQRTDMPDELYVASYAVYDWDISAAVGYLKMSPRTRALNKADLNQERSDFFTWIRNMAVLKAYNALEVFLINAVWITYFPEEKDPTSSKRASDNIQNKIKEQLIFSGLQTDNKNNRHLIEFLKLVIPDYSEFLVAPINIDLTTNWGDFFEMFSVLRNIIAHQGSLINIDVLNEIKSKAKDIFQRHFDVFKDEFNEFYLKPKEIEFSNFISSVNTFTLNTVKFASGQVDFNFLGMQ